MKGNCNHVRQMDNLSSPYQNGLMFLVLIPTHFEWCLFLSLSLSFSDIWFLILTFWAIQTCYSTTVSHSTHLLRGRQKACRYRWFDLIYILFCVIFTSIWISNNSIIPPYRSKNNRYSRFSCLEMLNVIHQKISFLIWLKYMKKENYETTSIWILFVTGLLNENISCIVIKS